MCSATGSGHVITCTARRWVVSGRLYCFQRPPAEGRREACKPSTDPTSRITNVRINRTAAHRSIFRPAFAEPPCCTQSTAAASRHRQDEKSCSFFQPGIPQIGSTYRKYAIAALPSAGRKILLIFPTRSSPCRLAVHKVQRRRPGIGRTKNYSSSSDRICSINRS